MTIDFFVPMQLPTITHQQKRVRVVNGKPFFYEPAALADARSKFMAYMAPHAPKEKLAGPVRLTTKWCYPRGSHPAPAYKTTKPDTDNMIKLLKDVMTELKFWNDDAQVASEITEKFWSNVQGLYVRIELLPKELRS